MHKFVRLLPFFVIIFLLCFGCSKEKTAKVSNDIEADKSGKKEESNSPITWYYFSNSDYGVVLKPIDSVEVVPVVDFLPWTEAVRLCNLTLLNERPVFLVNKAGFLPFFNSKDNPKILSNKVFENKTSGGFYNTDIGILTGFYNNTVFSSVNSYEGEYFLYCADIESGKLTPVISHKNFDLPCEAQLSDLQFRSKWFISFKTEKNNRVRFDYFSFDSFEQLLQKKYYTINQDIFRQAVSPVLINYEIENSASQKDVFEFILNKEFPVIIAEVFSYNTKSKKIVVKGDLSVSFEQLESCVCEFSDLPNKTNIKSAVLFSDGQFICFNYNSRKSESFLPTLPDNFVYTYFSVYENCLIAGWEEQSFFSVGRSGIIVVDLSKLNNFVL